jgi:hypothetical protein
MLQETRTLAVLLTEEELRIKADELAHIWLDKTKIEEEKKAVNSHFKSELDNLDAKAAGLSDEVAEKRAYRPVVCEWRPEYVSQQMFCIRGDTGEVVEKRTMSKDELQLELPISSARKRHKKSATEGQGAIEEILEGEDDGN